MSLSQKFYYMVSLIYLCQVVQSYNPRKQTICTQLVYNTWTGYTSVNYCCNGYTQDTSSRSYQCKPVYPTGSPNGSCMAPNVCKCDIGYTNNTATLSCEPSCFEPCLNGDCVAPGTCKCRPGFRQLNATHCEPIPPLCSTSCFNGDCVGPNMCKCHDGYYEHHGWGDRHGFEYTCLPETTYTTSTPETTAKINTPPISVTITEPDFTTQDVNEVTASVSNVSDGSVTVLVLFGGFTELDNNSPKNENTKNGSNIWIYISLAMLLVAILILLLIAFRRRVLGYIKGRTYVVQGEQSLLVAPPSGATVSSRTFNETFSSTSNEK